MGTESSILRHSTWACNDIDENQFNIQIRLEQCIACFISRVMRNVMWKVFIMHILHYLCFLSIDFMQRNFLLVTESIQNRIESAACSCLMLCREVKNRSATLCVPLLVICFLCNGQTRHFIFLNLVRYFFSSKANAYHRTKG